MDKQLKMTLSKIIERILKEDFGKIKKSSGKGYGTQQPYTIQSDKPLLGYVENEIDNSEDDQIRVKVSRAFLQSSN